MTELTCSTATFTLKVSIKIRNSNKQNRFSSDNSIKSVIISVALNPNSAKHVTKLNLDILSLIDNLLPKLTANLGKSTLSEEVL